LLVTVTSIQSPQSKENVNDFYSFAAAGMGTKRTGPDCGTGELAYGRLVDDGFLGGMGGGM